MGKISDSKKNMLARAGLPRERQETLIPCPVCEGLGKQLAESDGRYRQKPCRWCEGRGFVPALIFKLFTRWQRIRLVNRLAGRCI